MTTHQEYIDFRNVLLDERRKSISNGNDLNIFHLVRGHCQQFCEKFINQFPNLKMTPGFYLDNEHFWCYDETGFIIDPTVEQFGGKFLEPVENNYRVYNKETDIIRLGRCMNCGDEIFGIAAEGEKSVCSTDCQNDLEIYYNRFTRASR